MDIPKQSPFEALITIDAVPADSNIIAELEALTSQLAAETHHVGLLVHRRSDNRWFASESETDNLRNFGLSSELLQHLITDSNEMRGIFRSSAVEKTHIGEDGSTLKYFIFQGGNTPYNVVMMMQALPLKVSFEWFETLLKKQNSPLIAFVRGGQIVYPEACNFAEAFLNGKHLLAQNAWNTLLARVEQPPYYSKPDFVFPQAGFPYYTIGMPLAGGVIGMYFLPTEMMPLSKLPQHLEELQSFFNALMASIGTSPPFFVQSTSIAIDKLFGSPSNLAAFESSSHATPSLETPDTL